MQDPKYSLNPVMTIGDQLLEAARGIKEGAAARQHALGMLAAVRIRDPERVFRAWPHELSGGMGQRAMIAMMLMAEPELLIADEPTSALDVTVRLQVLAILDDLVKTRHMGLIFISHDLNLVRTFCDRVLVMYAGQVLETADRQRAGAGEASLYPRPARLSAGDRPSPRRACRCCSAIRPGWSRSPDERAEHPADDRGREPVDQLRPRRGPRAMP